MESTPSPKSLARVLGNSSQTSIRKNASDGLKRHFKNSQAAFGMQTGEYKHAIQTLPSSLPGEMFNRPGSAMNYKTKNLIEQKKEITTGAAPAVK